MPIEFDERALPIVRILLEGASSDAELDAYDARLLVLLRRAIAEQTKYGFVIDGRTAAAPDAVRRRRSAAWLDAHAPMIRAGCAATGIVLENAVQRGILKAILWLRPHPSPCRAFATPAEAEAWVRVMTITEGHAASA